MDASEPNRDALDSRVEYRSQKDIDVLGYSAAAVDEVYAIGAFPQPGSKTHIEWLCRRAGGQCATALIAAARLGLRCYFGGVLGCNELSDYMRDVFIREGIACPVSGPDSSARPFHSFILVERPTGERTILADSQDVHQISAQDLDESLISRSRVVLVDHVGPAGTLQACHVARQLQIPVVCDFERIHEDPIREAILLSDHLIMPWSAVRPLTGCNNPEEAVVKLAETKRPLTAVTAGKQGCWFISQDAPDQIMHQPAYTIKTTDTTGSGDMFHGAYAAALIWGCQAPAAIRFAAATAALTAAKSRGHCGIPNRKTVEEFLAKQEF